MKKYLWFAVPCPIPGGIAVINSRGLQVFISTETYHNDPRQWLHLSVSHADRYPTWEELMNIKDEFMGEEVEAYQILPKHSEYVNIHPN